MNRLRVPPADHPSRDFGARWRRLFAPRTGDLRLEMAEELSVYLERPVSEVLTLFDGAEERFAEEWRTRVASTSDESAVTAFYNESETEIFDLLQWHATDAGNQRSLVCADLLTTHRETGALPRPSRAAGRPRVLDYGSGVGTSAIVFADAGYDVTLADVAEQLLAFARWRSESRGFPVTTIDLKRARIPSGVFDAVVCFDVLEHIPKPLPVVRQLYNALRPGGLLFLVAPFGDDPVRPMHVVHDDRVLDWFRPLGFRRRDDMEEWFPAWMQLATPKVYEAAGIPAWKRPGYFLHDVVLPETAAGVMRAAWVRLAHRRA